MIELIGHYSGKECSSQNSNIVVQASQACIVSDWRYLKSTLNQSDSWTGTIVLSGMFVYKGSQSR